MKHCLNRVITYFSLLTIPIFLITSCTRLAPRVNSNGLPQHEYAYQMPDNISDGLETSSLSAEGIDPVRINEMMRQVLNGTIEDIRSVLLVRNGKLILEEYFYGYDREDVQYTASVTKSITSILVGMALDKKLIRNVNQKVYDFLPEYIGTRWVDQKYKITLEHTLSMTAGLDWDELSRGWDDPNNDGVGMITSNNTVNFVLNKKLKETPGEKFNYCGGLSHLLGVIIRKSSGLYADKFAEEHLFYPLGIANYQWYRYPDGQVSTQGGLSMRPRDMAKIGLMILNGGKWGSQRVVSQKWVTESTEAHVTGNLISGSGYGYQWWYGKRVINDQVIETFYASGTGGQYILIFPALDAVAVFTSKAWDNPVGNFRPQMMLTKYIIPAMLPSVAPQKIVKLDPQIFDKYVGDYEQKEIKVKLSIFKKGNKIYGKTFFFDKFELYPRTENQFTGTSKLFTEFQINFVNDEKKKPHRIILDVGFYQMPFDKIE